MRQVHDMKVCVLTRGGLTTGESRKKKLTKQPVQQCTTESSGVSRGHGTFGETKRKDRTVTAMKFELIRSAAMKADNPGKKTGAT